MRRWNGWGDDATSMPLGAGARAMLAERLGPGRPGQDAERGALLARIPPSRLPEHPLISRDPSERLAMALGESYADWIKKRFGELPPVLWRNCQPVGRWRRFARACGMLRNPFARAGDRELMELADFFLSRRIPSNQFNHLKLLLDEPHQKFFDHCAH